MLEFENKNDITIEGSISSGTQYDLEIKVSEDDRGAIFGIVKDSYEEPIKDAVVKLIEVNKEFGKTERKPVTHTFSDKNGQFVFGPICPNKKYEIEIWANRVEHMKICEVCTHHGKCLKGVDLKCDECSLTEKEEK